MAEGLRRHEAGDRFDVFSAGTKPTKVRPEAIAVMKELGIDISGHRSNALDEFVGQEFDYVIRRRPSPTKFVRSSRKTQRLHRPFEDPTDEASFRKVRDQIQAKIQSFIG